jgi:hypothetical protein
MKRHKKHLRLTKKFPFITFKGAGAPTCRIERKRIGYTAVVVHEGRPRVTTRISTLTRKGAEKVLRSEGCGGGLGRARRRRRR